jgi:dTDP-4-dehydrorhamnose reductase
LSRVRGHGTFHMANSGETTWYDFARAIVERAGLSHVRVEPISTEELGRPAPRPAYSVLDTSHFSTLAGYTPRHWTAALDEYLRIRREAAGSDGPAA